MTATINMKKTVYNDSQDKLVSLKRVRESDESDTSSEDFDKEDRLARMAAAYRTILEVCSF